MVLNNKPNFSIGKIEKVMIVSFFVNILLVIMKVVVGILGSSGALIADGIHSFSDLVTDVIAIIGNNFAKRPADSEHPFGHGKTEYITSLIIGIIIMLVGFTLINEMMKSQVTNPSKIVIIISFVTIVTKLLLALFLVNKGKKYDNSILIASGKESTTDVLSSIIVMFSAIAMQFTDKYTFLQYSDKIAGIIVGVFIINVGFGIVKKNISMTTGEQVTDEEYLTKINDIIINNDDVTGVEKLVILKYGPYYKLEGDVIFKNNILLNEAHDKIDIIESKIKEYDERITYITIHMSPNIEENEIQ
ncbi:MAG: cation diffusion facilitator family transporter [Bacilli bacterium]|nr:cation diffusion facilitator family transporter [Bacilli bacterium]MDD4547780.1 cation diffusion facilitator family transporter [Bacilli bacterium]